MLADEQLRSVDAANNKPPIWSKRTTVPYSTSTRFSADSEEQHPQSGTLSTVAQPISNECCKIVAIATTVLLVDLEIVVTAVTAVF